MQNNQDIGGSVIEVTNLIPLKSKDSNKTSLYVKHFPITMSEFDLKKFFGLYGDISTVHLFKDDRGASKGVAIITYTDPRSASAASIDLTMKGTCFPGYPPLYINYFMKKEERLGKSTITNTNESPVLLAKLAVNDENIVIIIY